MKKTSKIVERMCCVTRKKYPKEQLIRVAKINTDEFVIDEFFTLKGRGAYILNDPNVIQKAVQKKALHRTFRMEVPKKVYEALQRREEDYRT